MVVRTHVSVTVCGCENTSLSEFHVSQTIQKYLIHKIISANYLMAIQLYVPNDYTARGGQKTFSEKLPYWGGIK